MSQYNSYYRPNNSSNNNNNKKDDSWVSWTLIAIFFITGLWPVALALLFVKLFAPDAKKKQEAPPSLYQTQQVNTQTVKQQHKQEKTVVEETKKESKAKSAVKSVTRTPSESKKSTNFLLYGGIALAFIAIMSLMDPLSSVFSYGFASYYLEELLQYTAMAVAGGGMILGGINSKRAAKRYANYMAVVGSLEAISIDSLVRKTGYSKKRVVKDIQHMIDKGYFGTSAYLNVELEYLFLNNEADGEISALKKAAEQKAKEAANMSAKDEYSTILHNIRTANDRIADPVLSEKISRLEDITSKIFETIEREPKKKQKIDTFFNYYLPTTQKLLDTYAKLEATGADSENVNQGKQNIQDAMDSIVHGFECQLDELYKSDALDIETDIQVMQKMLDRDTQANKATFKDFNIKEEPAKSEGLKLTLEPQNPNSSTTVELGGGMAAQRKD